MWATDYTLKENSGERGASGSCDREKIAEESIYVSSGNHFHNVNVGAYLVFDCLFSISSSNILSIFPACTPNVIKA